MMTRWQWFLMLFVRRLWLRVALFAAAGILTAVLGIFLGPYVPDAWTLEVGARAVDRILDVLASSMLAVTVFSVSTIVTTYGTAAAHVTPRATRLLMEDDTSKNVIATFIGSFLFSLVGIIALGTGFYGNQGRVILLMVTIGLVALIAVTIMRWIDYLSRFGRLGETIGRVEKATWDAMATRLAYPHLRGNPLARSTDIPANAWPVFSSSVGYVQHVDMSALEDCARQHGIRVFLSALPGTFADPSRPLAMVAGKENEDAGKAVADAFAVAAERTFGQDPRFGLCVLAEIASRALSPSLNDPGTAIDVIGRAVRLLVRWSRHPVAEDRIDFRSVFVPGVEIDDMCDDIFSPIARDGAGIVEIQIRLQKALLALVEADRRLFGPAARRHSQTALARAEAALTLEQERQAVRDASLKVAAGA